MDRRKIKLIISILKLVVDADFEVVDEDKK